MAQEHVIVIGAGVAGLCAALRLAQAQWRVTVLEARARVGGRIYTLPASDGSVPLELGAEFVHGEKVATWKLLGQAGLTTHEVPMRQWLSEQGRLREEAGLPDDFERLSDAAEQAQPDACIGSVLDTLAGLNGTRRRLILDYIEGFHAADPLQMSAHAFADSERAASEVEGTRQFRINEGYGKLVTWLESRMKGLGVELLPQTCVKLVRWQRGQVRVATQTPDGNATFQGTRAIVTLPAAVLKSDGPGAVSFEPVLHAKNDALAGIQVGAVRKILLRFNRPLWPGKNFGFVHAVEEDLPTWWTDARGPVLTGWAGGPRSCALAAHSGDALRERLIETVARVFGQRPSVVSGELVELRHHEWSEDEFARGAYSYLGVGASECPSTLSQPVQDTLFFAGEATADHAQLGTVHGAIESGFRAAEETLRRGA